MEIIKRIEDSLRNKELINNPHECADRRAELAGEYSFWSGILEDILTKKPKEWNTMRSKHKSDKACDKEWEATDDGINETVIRLKLKRIEKLMSALSSLIRIAEGEANNKW